MNLNQLYEGLDLSQYSQKDLLAGQRLYNYITESAEIAKKEGILLEDVLDEGIFGAIVGGAAGATIGVSLTKAICKVLGIKEDGPLGKLMTSRLIMAALGAEIGYSI